MPVRLRNAGATRFRVEFDRNLRGPEQANALRVVLPGGLLQQAARSSMVATSPAAVGGWLLAVD